MSQSAPNDTDPSADNAPPSDADSGQDVPAALTPPVAAHQPSLTPETFILPPSREETTAEDTTATTDTPEWVTNHPDPTTQAHVIECDQAVSLEQETEAAVEDGEVCSSSSNFCTCKI